MKRLAIELPDSAYRALERAAKAQGFATVEGVAQEVLEAHVAENADIQQRIADARRVVEREWGGLA